MRLWSVHPRFYDRQALTACWREGLLAQAVIADPSRRGYANHPQLQRFRAAQDPLATIGDYLSSVVDEADARGYRFAREKILRTGPVERIPVARGQLEYEWGHLLRKLQARTPAAWERWHGLSLPDPHPLFIVEDGPIADWERVG
ncbi:pyrimidine dimer DNA glycosylase/endonuclease V [Microbacterium azadirachtae]|uniref:pyrimidine dimer DNA glycosylase/endonuclease V n=1 Tax=Microbacterium azadirachtae TaxID=582680 RepID=UPI003F74BC87